jgi:GNAT superfamily N-acetyltransferase
MKRSKPVVQVKGMNPITISRSEPEVREEKALSGGPRVLIRPVSPGDREGLREMLFRLSRETIYKRFHLPMPRVPEWVLAYLTDVDHYDKESLVALVGDEIVGQAMYARQAACTAEMAIVVEDRWQSRGIGKLLLSRLAEEAAPRKIEAFTGTVLGENRDALRFFSSVLSRAKFKIRKSVYHLYVPLPDPEPASSLRDAQGEIWKTTEDVERTTEPSRTRT